MRRCFLFLLLLWSVSVHVFGQDQSSFSEAIQGAIKGGLELVQKAARNYPDHRDCFSCHHQTLPMLAMAKARDRGFQIDDALLSEQAEFTREFYHGRIESVRKGKGVGGRAMTAGYALWAFDLAGHKKEETAEALVKYLLETQESGGNWKRQTHRPPMEEANITATYLAAYYMDAYAGEGDETKQAKAKAKAIKWMAKSKPKSQEGLNFKLLSAFRFSQPREVIDKLRDSVIKRQLGDGGWSQVKGLESDAYATGQTLFILRETAAHDQEDIRLKGAIEVGIRYLLRTRKADGSWHVKSRSKPIQKMFDNGDPHGTDQFISTPATAWAVAALLVNLPE